MKEQTTKTTKTSYERAVDVREREQTNAARRFEMLQRAGVDLDAPIGMNAEGHATLGGAAAMNARVQNVLARGERDRDPTAPRDLATRMMKEHGSVTLRDLAWAVYERERARLLERAYVDGSAQWFYADVGVRVRYGKKEQAIRLRREGDRFSLEGLIEDLRLPDGTMPVAKDRKYPGVRVRFATRDERQQGSGMFVADADSPFVLVDVHRGAPVPPERMEYERRKFLLNQSSLVFRVGGTRFHRGSGEERRVAHLANGQHALARVEATCCGEPVRVVKENDADGREVVQCVVTHEHRGEKAKVEVVKVPMRNPFFWLPGELAPHVQEGETFVGIPVGRFFSMAYLDLGMGQTTRAMAADNAARILAHPVAEQERLAAQTATRFVERKLKLVLDDLRALGTEPTLGTHFEPKLVDRVREQQRLEERIEVTNPYDLLKVDEPVDFVALQARLLRGHEVGPGVMLGE